MTIECRIEQKYHRGVLGTKGCNVQAITQEHNVSIKFPDRGAPKTTPTVAEGEEPALNGGEEGEKEKSRDVILITGRVENAEAAKEALLVSVVVWVCLLSPPSLFLFSLSFSPFLLSAPPSSSLPSSPSPLPPPPPPKKK